jgi:hypothetical protein
MANTTEEEIAHIDMRERGELKLTNKRLYGRVRLTPLPSERNNGNLIHTVHGIFRERDFDAPVSTIDELAVRRATGWIGTIVQSSVVVVGLMIGTFAFMSFLVAFCVSLVGAAISALCVYCKYRADQKIVIFQFLGNGELLKFTLPIDRKADLEDFVTKVTQAKQKALN